MPTPTETAWGYDLKLGQTGTQVNVTSGQHIITTVIGGGMPVVELGDSWELVSDVLTCKRAGSYLYCVLVVNTNLSPWISVGTITTVGDVTTTLCVSRYSASGAYPSGLLLWSGDADVDDEFDVVSTTATQNMDYVFVWLANYQF